jgi:hypothetical protein
MAKMNLKISVDEAAADRARRYARRHETSISSIVGDIFAALPLDDGVDVGRAASEKPPAPRQRRARGTQGTAIAIVHLIAAIRPPH